MSESLSNYEEDDGGLQRRGGRPVLDWKRRLSKVHCTGGMGLPCLLLCLLLSLPPPLSLRLGSCILLTSRKDLGPSARPPDDPLSNFSCRSCSPPLKQLRSSSSPYPGSSWLLSVPRTRGMTAHQRHYPATCYSVSHTRREFVSTVTARVPISGVNFSHETMSQVECSTCVVQLFRRLPLVVVGDGTQLVPLRKTPQPPT